MGRILKLVAFAWLAAGCCTNGRYPSDLKGGVGVGKDKIVKAWRVNGEKVCSSVIWGAPACYVLEVEYDISFVNVGDYSRGIALAGGPAVAGISALANTKKTDYSTGRVPFALRLRNGAQYYVTATFTGDEFLPRIVEQNAAGERISEITPARSQQELEDCRAGKPLAPAPPVKTSAAAALRASWTPTNDASNDRCD
jgi:hypothetical protein